jgi:hypothetical protein
MLNLVEYSFRYDIICFSSVQYNTSKNIENYTLQQNHHKYSSECNNDSAIAAAQTSDAVVRDTVFERIVTPFQG